MSLRCWLYGHTWGPADHGRPDRERHMYRAPCTRCGAVVEVGHPRMGTDSDEITVEVFR